MQADGNSAPRREGKASGLKTRPELQGATISNFDRSSLLRKIISGFVTALVGFCSQGRVSAQQAKAASLELSRAVRPWEFLSAVGQKAGLLGNESGRMEAWVYPLKLLRDFRLVFLTEGKVLLAETLARTVITRPESSTIVYASDTFSVRETFFVPVDEPGAVVVLEVETEFPLEIEARFLRDFTLEWPAGLGGTYSFWDKDQRAFVFGEETRRYSALVGSPTAGEEHGEYQTNYSESTVNSFRLGVTPKGRETKLIVMAGSLEGRVQAEQTYKHLLSNYKALMSSSAEYYRKYLAETVQLELPDTQLQQAYDWSRVSMVQGIVANPFLGTGLVAGYRTSGESQRPGFAWFFGRDSFWTSFALNAAGDFATTKLALEFVSKYQREDGKIPHEIAQGASFVPWFKDFPYGYASADATPLYIIAVNDYVTASGDVAYAKEKWASLQKAYEFMKSTYDEQGFPKNFGIGHGWVEGGPLLPVKTEFYHSGLGVEALRALANLARIAGQDARSKELTDSFAKQLPKLNEAFWLADKKRYAFALGTDGKPLDEPTVLTTVPMWFGLTDQAKASAMITQLADADQQTDWGMRIISGNATRFSGGGYHYGSVWPLFTGWASVGEYRYHRAAPAYANLRANALLALDGSLGHVTEVLSGDYYQPLSTSSPHQIWSASMVVSPILRGMLGLSVDALQHKVTFAPHLPAQWTTLSIGNVRVGNATLLLNYNSLEPTAGYDVLPKRSPCCTTTPGGIVLEVGRTSGSEDCTFEFRPEISLRAKVLKVELNNKTIPFQIETSGSDQHIVVRFPVGTGKHFLRIELQDPFGYSYHSALPELGSTSQGLRIISETWSASKDQLTLEVSGTAGKEYQIYLRDAGEIEKMEGGGVNQHITKGPFVDIQIPEGASGSFPHKKVIFHFHTKAPKS